MAIGDQAASAVSQLNTLSSIDLDNAGVNVGNITVTVQQLQQLGILSSSPTSGASTSTNANGQNVAPKNSTTGKDTSPPTTPSQSPNAVPKSGQPSIAPTATTLVKGTGINKTNQDLVHICDFTINLHLQACEKTWLTISENETLRLASLSTWASSQFDPIYDQLRTIYNTIKEWYNWIKKYVDQIKSFIKCMQEIIQAVQQAIAFISSLPSNLLNSLLSCISGFEKLFTDSVKSLFNGVTAGLAAQSNSSYATVATNASGTAPTPPTTPPTSS